MKHKLLFKFSLTIVLLISSINYAQEIVPFSPRVTKNLKGNLTLTGNSIVGLVQRDGDAIVYDPNQPIFDNSNNGAAVSAYIDIDGDPTTFSSSSADISIPDANCSKVVYAGLYWSANYYMARKDSPNDFADVEIASGFDTDTALIINNGSLAYQYTVRNSEFDNDDSDIRLKPVTSYLVVAQPVDGCGITNTADLDGNIAVIEAGGTCSLREKVVNAEAAGAVGVVIVNENGNLSRLQGNGTAISIPSVSIGNNDVNGSSLITELAMQNNVVLATLSTTGNDLDTGLSMLDSRKEGPADFRSIKFKTPGGTYSDIAAQHVILDGYRNTSSNSADLALDEVPYVCYADVTGVIANFTDITGTYTVGNMNATQGYTSISDGAAGGWMLVMIYENNTETNKQISINDGFASISVGGNPVDFTYNGFVTPPLPLPVNVKYGVASLEGDKGLNGDRLQFQDPGGNYVSLGDNVINPTTNFFNSSISSNGSYITARNPASENTLGFDVDVFDLPNDGNNLIENNRSSAVFRLTTDLDNYSVFFNTLVIENVQPELQVIKKVFAADGITEITGGNVELGDQIFYDLEIKNSGNEGFVDGNIKVKDVLPSNLDLLGVVDATLPPGVNYFIEQGSIEFNIPASIVETTDASILIRYRAQISNNCEGLRDACSNIIGSNASASYVGALSGIFIQGDESSSAIDACNTTNGSSTDVFLNNIPPCSTEVVFCAGDLQLITGTGYDRYTWTGPGIASPVVTTTNVFNVSNPQSGTYSVTKEDTNPADGTCMTLTEEFVTEDPSNLVNPILDYVNGTTVVTENCSGLEIPQILLCGDQSMLLETYFDQGNLNTISWQRLSPSGSCLFDLNDPCSLLSGDCTDTNWITEPGGNTAGFTVRTAGDYRILAEFNGGCIVPFYFSVFKNNYQPQLTMEPIECGNDGMVMVTNVPINFAFSLTQGGPYTNSNGVFPIPAGSQGDITVYAIDTTFPGCEYTATIDVPEINPVFSVTTTDPTCINDDNSTGLGSIEINITGGVPEYQYTISSPALGAANPIIVPNSSANNGNYIQENLPPGTYTVELISNIPSPECIYVDTVTINPAPAFNAEVVLLSPETCSSGAKVQINVLNGSGNYRYADSTTGNFQLSNIFEIPSPADPSITYTFFVSDENIIDGLTPPCIIEVSIDNILPYQPIVDNVLINEPSCAGDTGQINVSVSPQVIGRIYTYRLLDQGGNIILDEIVSPSTDITFTNVAGGTYFTEISHNNEADPNPICPVINGPFTITEPATIEATVSVIKELGCITGQEDALIAIENITGGTGSGYEWSLNPNGPFAVATGSITTFNVPTAGTYSVFIRDVDAPSCVIGNQITIAPLEEISNITFTENSSDCNAQTVNITAVAEPEGTQYIYEVLPEPVSGDINTGVFTLSRGVTHTITATRADNGCAITQNFTSDVLPAIQIVNAVETNPAICAGDFGSLGFTVANSNSFEYTISLGATVVNSGTGFGPNPIDVDALVAGTYTIMVTDTSLTPISANCRDVVTVDITEPFPIDVTIDPSPATNGTNGSVQIFASGGTPPYQYSIDNNIFVTENLFTNLTPGLYNVTVRDANGCDQFIDVIIESLGEPISVELVLDNTFVTCFGDSTASISSFVSGGSGMYTYNLIGTDYSGSPINAVSQDGVFESLTAGNYEYIVSSNGFDSVSVTFAITQPTAININSTVTHETVSDDGVIEVIAIGGTAPYLYELQDTGGNPFVPFQMDNLFTGLVAGEYLILVQDSNACINTQLVTILPPVNESPLIEYADEILFCAAIGQSYPVITIQNENGEVLDVPFSSTLSIVWQKLDDINCTIELDPVCPTTDSSCSSDWFTFATGTSCVITEDGEYRVVIEFVNKSVNNTQTYYFRANANTLGVGDNDDTDFTMYPNPSKDMVYINKDITKVEVIDVTGKVVLETSEKSFSIASLNKGVYFVKIQDNKIESILKLMRQ